MRNHGVVHDISLIEVIKTQKSALETKPAMQTLHPTQQEKGKAKKIGFLMYNFHQILANMMDMWFLHRIALPADIMTANNRRSAVMAQLIPGCAATEEEKRSTGTCFGNNLHN